MESVTEPSAGDRQAGAARGASGLDDRLDDLCIVTLARTLRVLEANGDFIRRLGRSAAQVYGTSFVDLVHPECRSEIVAQLAELGQGLCDRFSSRFTGLGTDGSAFPADVTGVAVRGNQGRVSTIVLLVRPGAATAPPVAGARRKPLSELDARVLEGIAAGISTLQLASKLYLSRQGIEYHVGAMLRRFKSPNRSALVAKAYAQGILTTGEWPPRVTPEFVR